MSIPIKKGSKTITECTPAISLWSQARGLMFSKKRNLLFIFNKEKICSLHMFFVFFPIHVYFLDEKKEIVEIKSPFNPWTFHNPKKKAKYILELVEPIDVTIGDEMNFSF